MTLQEMLQSKSKELYPIMSEVLTDREERIIRLRYGLDDDIPRPTKTIAKEFNLTEKMVLSHEKKAMQKLEKYFNDKGLNK